jgi:hypothetical protein
VNTRSRNPSGLASDRALAAALVLASAAALCALFWPTALRRVFLYGDLGIFFLPFRIFLSENLARGITPLWMPNLFCGYYAHGEGPIGIFHPLRWLLYRFLPVTEAFNLECILPYPLALIGVALFVRRRALPVSAAIFGGLTFAFSAYMTVRLAHLNALAVLAHLGWLLLAIDIVLRDRGRKRWLGWLGAAAATASQVLIGYPPAIAYSWMLAVPYALLVAVRDERPRALLAVAGALGAGLLLGAVQLVPTWDYLAASLRTGATYEFLTDQSLHPFNLLSIVAPWLFRDRLYMDSAYNPIEQALYFGPVVPIAAVWVVERSRRIAHLRSVVAVLLALSGLALVLALGKHTPLYRYFLEIPVIGLLRVPARYSIGMYAAGAAFAAIAFAELLRGDASASAPRPTTWLWAVPAASWAVAAAALAFRDPAAEQGIASQLNGAGWIALGPAAFTLAAALFTAAVRGHRSALYGLAVLALADQTTYAATLWWTEPPRTVGDYRARIDEPAARPPFRITTPANLFSYQTPDQRWHYSSPTMLIVNGARLVSGYAAVAPATRLNYGSPASLRAAGATVRQSGNAVEQLSGAVARAHMVANAVHSLLPKVAISEIDLETSALVDEPLDLEAGEPGEAEILEDLPGSVRIATRAESRQLLVLSESFHSGWRVAIDGEARPAIRANGDFLGVVVEAGDHRVEFSFRPRSFEIGRAASLAGIALVAIAGSFAATGGAGRSARSAEQRVEVE